MFNMRLQVFYTLYFNELFIRKENRMYKLMYVFKKYLLDILLVLSVFILLKNVSIYIVISIIISSLVVLLVAPQ